MSTVSLPTSMRFVRVWVHVYTAGLRPSVRGDRREEIEADLWEQAMEATLNDSSRSELASHVLMRWALGVPDDLLWRVAQLGKGNDSGAKETAMVQSPMSRTMGYGVGGLALILLTAALTFTVANQIERGFFDFGYARAGSADYAWLPETGLLLVVVWPLAIGLIVGGFRVMPRSPSLGAFLVVVASAAFAAVMFWLIIPPLVAVAVSVYAIRRARRLRQRG